MRNGHDSPSTIYGVVNSWYATKTNLPSLQTQYIDENAGFCNDRQASTANSGSTNSYGYYVGNGSGGTSTTNTWYGAYIRLTSNGNKPNSSSRTITPTFRCADIEHDLYTYTRANQGNKVLANPVGLITADEASYAGLVFSTNNTSNYLYTGQNYWTMSPTFYNGNGAAVSITFSDGRLNTSIVNNTNGVRPVINLRSDIQLSGDGTTSNPYQVS